MQEKGKNNRKKKINYEQYIFLLLGMLGIILILLGLYYYYSTQKVEVRIDDKLKDLSIKQLPPEVACKLIEEELRKRKNEEWNCSVYNSTSSTSPEDELDEKVENLSYGLCRCVGWVGDKLKVIDVRVSK